jgi:hypothetical protein
VVGNPPGGGAIKCEKIVQAKSYSFAVRVARLYQRVALQRRNCDQQLGTKWGTICTLVEMTAGDGKRRKTQAANAEGLP